MGVSGGILHGQELAVQIELREKLNGADPYEWAKEYIKTLNEKEKQQKREILVPFKQSKLIDKGEQHSFNGGYLFLQKIYCTNIGFSNSFHSNSRSLNIFLQYIF